MKKIVVPALAICVGAAIAGSVSGTVAWYQYSTRASTAYLGTTAGTAGNLKLRIKGTNTPTNDAWVNSLTKDDIAAYLAENDLGKKIIQITAGNIGADDAIKTYNAAAANEEANYKPLFFKNPIRSFEERVDYDSASWLKADESMYVQIPLEVAFIEFDGVKKGEEDKEYLDKDVFLSDLLIQADWQNDSDPENLKKDLSDAIRVHISTYEEDSNGNQTNVFNRLISKKGGSILTEGYLPLGDGVNDDTFIDGDHAAQYGFGNSASIAANTKKVIYGEGKQEAYSIDKEVKDGAYRELDADADTAEKVYPAVVKSVGNSMVLDETDFEYTKEGASETTKKAIGKTVAYDKTSANWETKYLNVVITIWLEGWQTLPAPTQANPNAVSSIWNASDYIGSMFDVGIQFATQAE